MGTFLAPSVPQQAAKWFQEVPGGERPLGGARKGPRRFSNGAKMTPRDLVEDVGRKQYNKITKLSTFSCEKLDFGRLKGQKFKQKFLKIG